MNQDIIESIPRREALKRLRETRKDTIEKISALVKRQRKDIQAITGGLKEGGQTVPQLAEKSGLPAAEVFWYLSTLKKYGKIKEGEKVGNYFKYWLTEEAGAEEDEPAQEGNL